jgi:peptidoglycan/LPS O-acetylase OafA/YrhL
MYLQGRAARIAHASAYAAAVCIALTFPIAFLAYRYVEEPGRRWLRVLFEGRGTDPVIRANLSQNVKA